MLTHFVSFWVYWGIWLIIPFLIDGVAALALFFGLVYAMFRKKAAAIHGDQAHWPRVSIIIPVANGEKSLGQCLQSIRQQTYPARQLEVVVVDNASTDDTVGVFQHEQAKLWDGQMHWISIPFRGKPGALNTGIHMTTGHYVINIDADVALSANAIEAMVAAFESDPSISAATGGVEVLPAAPEDGLLPYLIAECEFQEYLSAFWMGRQYQTMTNSLFTLAGAFSAFRREALLHTFLYDGTTVSEDTKLTLDIYKHIKAARIVCVPEAIVYLEPTPSLSSLYAQRVRWQRGQLEVAALNPERIRPNFFQMRGLSLSRLLMIDHTLLFPRLVWMFLFPLMVFFGYPFALVFNALVLMYIFYAGINYFTTATTFPIVGKDERKRLLKSWWIPILMPAYRFLIFLFRVAGSIIPLKEPAAWRVKDPILETRLAWGQLVARIRQLWGRLRR
ncbi:MAG: TIGR03111 family XrtG-associated glycosyltransferase [Chloroflexota bacterium]